MGKIKTAIYGARSLALGCYYALRECCKEYEVVNFLVNSLQNNVPTLAGLPVFELENFPDRTIHIVIATPEDLHEEIIKYLKENGFNNFECMNWERESELMEKYYFLNNIFPSIHCLKTGSEKSELCVYSAKFYKDKPLKNVCKKADFIEDLQVGTALTDIRICQNTDNTGENISSKNVNYCELTALYWIWKNKLFNGNEEFDYYGLFHYRRMLDINNNDLLRLKENNVDVILPFPTMHEPDIKEHHCRYIKESDWEAMLRALEELYPEYYSAYNEIFSQEYMYNYNIIVAKKDILLDYCSWLFPILKRTEELSVPKGDERADRYIGYLGESLLTLYVMYNKNKFNIVHSGIIMLT